MANVNKNVMRIMQTVFKTMLKGGAFPEVQYKTDGFGESYMLVEYSVRWSTFADVANRRMKEAMGVDIWTSKRSEAFIKEATVVIAKITIEDVLASPSRMKTWCD